jgi:hypothetical protein
MFLVPHNCASFIYLDCDRFGDQPTSSGDLPGLFQWYTRPLPVITRLFQWYIRPVIYPPLPVIYPTSSKCPRLGETQNPASLFRDQSNWGWAGVGLVPKRGCLLTLAYYAFPIWYEFGERRWNDTLTGENRRTRRKTCPSATLSSTNPTWIDPGTNPGLRGERSATNNLSYGMASMGFSKILNI